MNSLQTSNTKVFRSDNGRLSIDGQHVIIGFYGTLLVAIHEGRCKESKTENGATEWHVTKRANEYEYKTGV